MKHYYIRNYDGEIRELEEDVVLGHAGTPKEGIWIPYVEPEVIEQVPESVTPRQLLLVLNEEGITIAAIKSDIATIENPKDRRAAEIEFDMASEFKRTHPLIAKLAHAMGKTQGQVDQLFIAASKL